ncbi:phenylacetate--CoA ligase family protein [Motilimonas pumila]|nr:phenylacetate--CoA ligase family protein [Motilimonas pumila]
MKQVQQKIEALEFDHQALEKYVDTRILQVTASALKNIDYYKSVKIDVDKYDSATQLLEHFPLLDKDIYLEHGGEFFNRKYKGLIIDGASSGTTGVPLKVPQSLSSVIRESAFVWRQLKWAGYQKGDKRMWLRGDMVVPLNQKSQTYWRYSYFENMLLLSSFHLDETNIPLYVKQMVRFGGDIIQAYPSSIVAIAKYLKLNGMKYPGKVKSIITSSEILSQWDRLLLEDIFQCKVFDWYGLFERVAAIGTCEYGRYHQLTDYSHVEYHANEQGSYELVGTNFNNPLYPFLRYKTNDYVKKSNQKCPCGRHYPVIDEIIGRERDYLVTESGPRLTMVSQLYANVEGLVAVQFIQESYCKLDVLIVINEAYYTAESQNQFLSNIRLKLGNSFEVEFFKVSSIPRTKSGKVKYSICSVDDF